MLMSFIQNEKLGKERDNDSLSFSYELIFTGEVFVIDHHHPCSFETIVPSSGRFT